MLVLGASVPVAAEVGDSVPVATTVGDSVPVTTTVGDSVPVAADVGDSVPVAVVSCVGVACVVDVSGVVGWVSWPTESVGQHELTRAATEASCYARSCSWS